MFGVITLWTAKVAFVVRKVTTDSTQSAKHLALNLHAVRSNTIIVLRFKKDGNSTALSYRRKKAKSLFCHSALPSVLHHIFINYDALSPLPAQGRITDSTYQLNISLLYFVLVNVKFRKNVQYDKLLVNFTLPALQDNDIYRIRL